MHQFVSRNSRPALLAGIALTMVGLLVGCGVIGGGASTTTSGTITSIAGTSASGFSGDGALAINAQVNLPVALAVDSSGNVFIADSGNNRIRKITASSGVITTIAGNGVPGYSGDGGLATAASLNTPRGVAVDGSGNVFISDSLNNRIRKITVSSGIITTIAGTTAPGFAGDGGSAVNAQFSSPGGIAIDGSGNLYIADRGNARIRMISASGTVSTVAGNGTPGFAGDSGPATSAQINVPAAVAVDSSGAIYIADSSNHRVRKVTGGNITTIAGNGSAGFSGDGAAATAADLNNPQGITVDGSGNVYIADTANSRVRRIVPGGNITTVAGSATAGLSGDGGSSTGAQLFQPNGVAFASSVLYIADTGNNRIRKVTF